MNAVPPKNRMYTVLHFRDDSELQRQLNTLTKVGWTIEKVHFKRFWRCRGWTILYRKRPADDRPDLAKIATLRGRGD